MSLTVQQLLSDAKRLSSRLRDHDQSADHLISRAQEVLKEVDAMRQYQEDVENLNEVAHNRPRAQLVLGIQQENRHIRTLQQENKELRASLEEHQNALELIMSKYRQHVTRLVSTPYPDMQSVNNQKIQMLADRTEKVCEMAAIMKESVRVDEEACNQQQELMARLMTENKGLRELLEISKKNNSSPKVKKMMTNVNKEVQTESVPTVMDQEVSVTLPMPVQPRSTPRLPKIEPDKKIKDEQSEEVEKNVDNCLDCGVGDLSSGDSDETGSEDESIKYDTIKLADRRNKETAKTRDMAMDQSDLNKLPPEEQREEKSDMKSAVKKSEYKAECVEMTSQCKTTEIGAYKSERFEQVIDGALVTGVVEKAQESSDSSLSKSLTEGQQNIVLVNSLIDQLIDDSVESSSSTLTGNKKAASEESITNLIQSVPDYDTVAQDASITNIGHGITPDVREQITTTPTSSSNIASKNTKMEPSHRRSNSKGKNKKNTEIKENKTSQRKGNKK